MTIPAPHEIEHRFRSSDIELISTSTFVERVHYRTQLDSTNCRAKQLSLEDSSESSCVLVLADRQTAGRGRGANRWWSTGGSLTFSLLLRPGTLDLPANRWPQLSLTMSLAVCAAIESLDRELQPRIKWPNDVYLGERKLCGILIEAPASRRGGCLIVGVGINVNNSCSEAPPDLKDKVIALSDALPVAPKRVDVLVAILRQFNARLKRMQTGAEQLRDEWSRWCLLTGRFVEVEVQKRRFTGTCRGIDDEGALLIATDAGIQRCVSGSVTRFVTPTPSS